MPTIDTTADYSDAIFYDLENDSFEPDGPFYLQQALAAGGPVLDIGCGTGRITLPLARAGVDIWGLDVAPSMLALAREKAHGLPTRWVQANAVDFDIDETFALILSTGDTFRHLLRREDQENMLACMLRHLRPNGLLVLSILLPRPGMMGPQGEEQHWYTLRHEDGYDVRVSGVDGYDPIEQIRSETAYRRWTVDGQEVVQAAPLSLRFLFPQEMSALLHYNGLEVVHRYGDWDRGPVTPASTEIVYVCRAAGEGTEE